MADDGAQRTLSRVTEIGRVATRHGFGYMLDRRRASGGEPGADRGRRLRELLDELGPTFVKFGQLLSTRPDVVHLNQFAFGALPFAAPTLLVAHSCVCSWWEAVHGEPAPSGWDDYRDVVRRGLDGADLAVAPTRAMLDALERAHGARPHAVVLPNGRRAAAFPPGRTSARTSPIPACSAIALAVRPLSPVIIIVRRPISCRRRIAAGDESWI